ncbi:PREDICTED: hydrocephalus-inducing protein-like, partial [Amphimedon queenslandica]|uniref:Uncharacterized protein n=1 Tax=Amphimedon queenslandica TaxID=400682 RepID=A0AAN0K3N2_AMPQE
MEELLIQIDPCKGEIPPEQEQMIAVRYSPLEIGSILYKLHCKIQHLESSAKPLDLIVQGNSLVPYCHFDLAESDYLRTRRPTNVSDSAGCVTGRIDPCSKVIEFVAKGTGVRIIKSVHIH